MAAALTGALATPLCDGRNWLACQRASGSRINLCRATSRAVSRAALAKLNNLGKLI